MSQTVPVHPGTEMFASRYGSVKPTVCRSIFTSLSGCRSTTFDILDICTHPYWKVGLHQAGHLA